MPRYQLSEGRSHKFWEIELQGKTICRWWGRIGTAGQFGSRNFPSNERAQREYRRLIENKVQAGYRLIGGDPEAEVALVEPAVNSELEAALFADPDNADAYQVYGDWLQAQGDPRGELVAVQHALALARARMLGEDPTAARDHAERILELRRAEELLLERHRGHFLGDLAPYTPGPATSNSAKRRQGWLGLDWRFGFIFGAQLDLAAAPEEGHGGPELLRRLFAHPSARFLQRLEIQVNTWSGREGSRLVAPVVELLTELLTSQQAEPMASQQAEPMASQQAELLASQQAELMTRQPTGPAADNTGPAAVSTGPAAVSTGPAADNTGPAAVSTGPAAVSTGPAAGKTGPAAVSTEPAVELTTLRELALGPVEHGEVCEGLVLGDLRPLLAAWTGLRRLSLAGQSMRIGGRLTLPQLRELSLTPFGRLPGKWLSAVEEATWPHLERLCLCGVSSAQQVGWLLDASQVPALRRLALKYCIAADEVIGALAGSRLLGQLELLDLTAGGLTDHGARVLRDRRDRFAHLRLLNLDGNDLSGHGGRLVEGVCRRVQIGSQYGDVEQL